jgi:excisionase family DNA binding protein
MSHQVTIVKLGCREHILCVVEFLMANAQVYFCSEVSDMRGKYLMEISSHDVYRAVFKEYPDVLDVKQVSAVLGVSTKVVYRLLRDGTLESLKIGREFRVPKVNVMKYVKVFSVPLPSAFTGHTTV